MLTDIIGREVKLNDSYDKPKFNLGQSTYERMTIALSDYGHVPIENLEAVKYYLEMQIILSKQASRILRNVNKEIERRNHGK